MKVYVQVLTDKEKSWEETPFKELDVIENSRIGQIVANITGYAVRVTKPFGDVHPNQLSGTYFRPE